MSQDIVTRLGEALGRLKAPSDGPRYTHRIVLDLAPIDPLDWLRGIPHSGGFYWQDRDDKMRTAAIGEVENITITRVEDTSETLHRIADTLRHADAGVRYFGSLRFDPARPHAARDARWERFGVARFVLPRFEVFTEDNKSRLACHVSSEELSTSVRDEILAAAGRLDFNVALPAMPTPYLLGRADKPDRAKWNHLIETMLETFARGGCDKLVLARRTELDFADTVDPWSLLKRLRDQNKNCFVFGFQADDFTTFMGASPERLYRRNGVAVHTEAVAGTRPVGAADPGDDPFATELTESAKDRHEHELVVDGLTAALDRVCERYSITESATLLRLRSLQHLITRIEGELRGDVDDSQLLSALHPTPAVGGWPRERAMEHLRAQEPFDRGLYTGPVGWIATDSAEFAVAIRSALVHDRLVDLFAGAGIVPGSDPDVEWIEVESKILPFLVLLYGGRL